MELKEFIENTLVDIAEGIKAAKSKLAEDDTFVVAPHYSVYSENKAKKHHIEYDIQDIEFDVAVTASDKISGDLHVGIKVLGAKTEGAHENTNISRIKFIVCVGVQKS